MIENRIITKEFALELIRKNTNNRPLKAANIDFLKKQFLAGEFVFNGDTIKISSNDVLLDGQHRLMACIETGVPFQAVIVRNLNASVFDTIDQGNKRTLGDIFAMDGKKNYNNHAAIVFLLYYYSNYGVLRNNGGFNTISKKQLVDFSKENPGIEYSCQYSVNRSMTKKLIPLSYIGALHYLFSRIDSEKCEQFMDKLEFGEGLDKYSPENILRQRLLSNQMSCTKKEPNYVLAAYCIKAWNASRKGRKITYIKWVQSGVNKEAYPKPI
jgi:hypothetical protein